MRVNLEETLLNTHLDCDSSTGKGLVKDYGYCCFAQFESRTKIQENILQMNLPPFAPYPPSKFRKQLVPEEWEACLDAWLSLSELNLRLDQKDFGNTAGKSPSLISFLKSYYHHQEPSNSPQKDKEHTLKKTCFVLTHRLLLGTPNPPPELLQWEFLADFSHAYTKTQSLDALLQTLWQRKGNQLEASAQNLASTLLKQLESPQPETALANLKQAAPFLHASPSVGKVLMTGSDFVDALSAAYSKGSTALRESLVTTTYLGILSLMKGDKPNYSLIFDHLYGMRTQAERGPAESLLADLVTNTPILSKLRTGISGKDADRAQNLAAALDKYRSPSLARVKKPSRRPTSKGKGKAPAAADTYGHNALSNDQHIHRMSLITQIQDLFPDLGSAFISRLLDEYSESVEEATAHLLDESLPPHLSALDRAAELPTPGLSASDRSQQAIEALAPRSTPPPERRNVFDDDDFDRLEVSASRMHTGRRNGNLTADAVLADRSNAPAKSAILSALAAFDSDDDERDDTYDEADVGGLVDSARPDGEDRRDVDVATDHANEEALFRAWSTDKGVFERSADARRAKGRAALKSETGMTDEAIEGWGIMLSRDPRRQRRLENKFSAFHGGQNEIGRSAYRREDDEDGTEDSEGGGPGAGRGRGRGRGGRGGGGAGRGRGRGGGGRGGNVAGAPGDKGTQIARQRKEARGSNRQAGRARKMARAGFAG